MNYSLVNVAELSDEEVEQRKFESYLSLVGLGLGGGLFLVIILAARMNILQIIFPAKTYIKKAQTTYFLTLSAKY